LVNRLQNSRITDVARTYVDLKGDREAADYDHLWPVSKEAVLSRVKAAEAALGLLEAAPSDERDAFFALLALGARR
jgi:hypothetical protein